MHDIACVRLFRSFELVGVGSENTAWCGRPLTRSGYASREKVEKMRHVLAHKVFDKNVLGRSFSARRGCRRREDPSRRLFSFILLQRSTGLRLTRTSARTVTNSIVNAATSADAMWISPVHQT